LAHLQIAYNLIEISDQLCSMESSSLKSNLPWSLP
jgi:hypothetical protein